MGLVDWNAAWNGEILISRRTRLNSGRFWDEVAERDQGEARFPEELTELHLGRIAAAADETVLEIGPGMGRLTVPLARAARAVTVVDPSAGMLQRLRARADAEGLTNLRTVHESWEDAEREGIRPHSVVSSRMPDHVLLFNLLHDLGIDADVEVLRGAREERYASHEEAVDEQMRFHDAPEETRAEIAAYLAPRLREEGGGFALTKTVKTGVLRWRVA